MLQLVMLNLRCDQQFYVCKVPPIWMCDPLSPQMEMLELLLFVSWNLIWIWNMMIISYSFWVGCDLYACKTWLL